MFGVHMMQCLTDGAKMVYRSTEADISITRWNGRFINYYGPNGATYVDVVNSNIRTAFHKDEFDENIKRMREVLKANEEN